MGRYGFPRRDCRCVRNSTSTLATPARFTIHFVTSTATCRHRLCRDETGSDQPSLQSSVCNCGRAASSTPRPASSTATFVHQCKQPVAVREILQALTKESDLWRHSACGVEHRSAVVLFV